MNEGTILLSALGFLFVFVLVFLLTREFWCWYWKINEVVSLLRENNRLLQVGLKVEAAASPSAREEVVRKELSKASRRRQTGTMKCPNCGGTNPNDLDDCQWCHKPMWD